MTNLDYIETGFFLSMTLVQRVASLVHTVLQGTTHMSLATLQLLNR